MTFWNSFYPRYENATLDTFIVKSLSAARLLAVVREACEHGFTRNIIVSGQVGTGKTFLARSIIKKLSVYEDSVSPISKRRYRTFRSETARYCLIGDIIQERRAMLSGDTTASIEDYISAPLLIIDEIGVQFKTDSERTILFPIFDERYNRMLPTVVFSNFKKIDIRGDKCDLLNTLGQRICDRLFSDGLYFELNYPSLRGAV